MPVGLHMSTTRQKIFSVGLLLFITFVLYCSVLKHELLNWDDGAHLYDNLSLRGLDSQHLRDIFTSYVNDIYIPLTTLSFAIEYRFFEFNPFVYHLNNLILHLLIVLLVFVVAQHLGLSLKAAFLGTLIFAIHPIHVESVAWVTERKDVLYSFFYILAVYFYLRHVEAIKLASKKIKVSRKYLFATEFFAVLSLLAKPMALSLPLILLLLDWFLGRKIERKTMVEKIPVFILTILIAWATYAVQARIPGKNITEGFLVWTWTLSFYIRQFFVPFFSVPIYRLPKPVTLTNPEYILGLVIITLLAVVIIRFHRHRWFRFALGYLFFSIFFLLRYDDVKDVNVVADRFMYLPSLGLCLWLGVTFERLISSPLKERAILRTIAALAVIVLFGLLSVKTYQQCLIWHDNISLWTHELRYFPEESIALNNLATALRDQKPYQDAEGEFRQMVKAHPQSDPKFLLNGDSASFAKIRYIIELYERAVQSDPQYDDAAYNLGNVYKDLGLFPDAISYYQKTIERNKDYKDAYFNLGVLYRDRGEPKKAIETFNNLIAIDPDREISYENIIVAYNKALREGGANLLYERARSQTIEAYHNLLAKKKGRDAYTYFKMGYVYNDMKKYEKAIQAYEMALSINPNYVDALYNLGNTYEELGESPKALESYKKIISISPRYAKAFLNMGVIYSQQGQYQQAEEAFRKAAELPPPPANAYFNLGYIYEVRGEGAKAIEAYKKTIEIDSKHAEAYYNMGNVYVGLGVFDKALESYEQTLQINPKHLNAMVNASLISFQLGNYKNAVFYCDQAVRLGYQPEDDYLKALEPYRTVN